jgi:hypothetical protein
MGGAKNGKGKESLVARKVGGGLGRCREAQGPTIEIEIEI